MKKKSAEDYLDKLLNSVNDEKVKKEKFKETAKMLEDAMSFWEKDGAYLDFEEVENKAAVNGEKRSEQEDFLDALLSGAQNTEFGMNKKKDNPNSMYSRRVSRSEADFLREFEAELAGGDDDFSDLFAAFNQDDELETEIKPEDRLEAEDIHIEQHEADSFTLGDVDLASLVNEAAGVMEATAVENIPADDIPMDDVPLDETPLDEMPMDVLGDLFGEEAGIDLAESVPAQPVSSEGIDLGNLGEEDLMNLLAGADDLSDIGNMLSQSEVTEIPLEELEAFAMFAENEMSAQQVSAEPVEEEIQAGKKDKKGNFIGKIKTLLTTLMKDDEDDEVALKSGKAPTAEALSGENADILAELDKLEEKTSGKKEKKKKEKKKKENKPKKEKKPKTPKPKKEKKPKEVDNTPPLPKGPVFMIWLMVVSLVALVLLGVNLIKYNTPIANAKSLQNQGHYAEAFAEIKGLEVKEKDMEFYNQLAVLSTVDSELNQYEVFSKAEMNDKAFDSLICAAGRCYINEENADVYGCLGQLEILKKTVSNELEQKYNMTYDEAIEMYTIRDRDDYTLALYKKLTELGIDWE